MLGYTNPDMIARQIIIPFLVETGGVICFTRMYFYSCTIFRPFRYLARTVGTASTAAPFTHTHTHTWGMWHVHSF